MNKDYIEPIPQSEKTPKWLKVLGTVIFSIILTIMLIIIAFNLSFEYHDVEGPSMQPTLNEDLANKDGVYIFKLGKISPGDIVVFRSPISDVLIIKRLIAEGGDNVAVVEDGKNYKILVRKAKTNETVEFDYSFLGGITTDVLYNDFYNKETTSKHFQMIDGVKYMYIPENCVFYIGDNMNIEGKSEDCADYGPKDRSGIVGKVQIIIKGRTNHLPQIITQIFDLLF